MRHLPIRRSLAGLVVLLAGCASSPQAPPRAATPASPGTPPTADFHLLMGELALARGEAEVAVSQYAAASRQVDDADLARRATMIALYAGDHDAARTAASRWEALAPDDPEVAQFQAVLHLRAGETAAALDYLLRITEETSGTALGARMQMITSLLAGEDNRWRAADLLAALARARPEPAEGWYGAALLALEADRPAQAVAFAERALARDPNLLDAMFLRARAQLLEDPGSPAGALSPLAGFRHSADPGQRYRFAGLLVLAGETAQADALYEDILVNNPDQHDARMARALLALDAGRLEVAQNALHTLLERHGRVQDALYFLGVVAEQRGELHDAIDWYSQVAPEVERWPEAQAAVGRLRLQLDGPAAAQRFFDDARDQWPSQALALTLHEAALLTASGHAGLALAVLEEAPFDHVELRWQKALATAETGNLAEAEHILRGLLEQDPGNPSLQNALGYLLIGKRNEEAASLLEAALAAAPASPAVLDSLGWLRLQQGELEEARRLLEESWRRAPAAVTGMHLLALLEIQGDNASAAALRRTLREQFPQSLENEDRS